MITKTVCFNNPAYLSLTYGQLCITYPKDIKPSVTLPIEDIGIVVLDNPQITMTNALVEALLAETCAIIFCDSKHMPVGLTLPLHSNSIQHERFMNQIGSSLPLKKQLWQQTVQMKIHNQRALLIRHSDNLHLTLERMESDVKSGDSNNLEARAAAYYWKNIFQDDPLFTRDQNGDGYNILLNYGYAILRATVARALVCSGLLPTLGIHHHNRYNAYCLADDIMEPYRPYVDQKVLEIVSQNNTKELTYEIKRSLLEIPQMDVIIDGIRHPLMVGVSITASSLEKCFSGEKRKISYPDLADGSHQ